MSTPDIAERIAQARREAESLKERIRQRRDVLADTTCKQTAPHLFFNFWWLDGDMYLKGEHALNGRDLTGE